MKRPTTARLLLLLLATVPAGIGGAQEPTPAFKVPEPSVPERFTLQGQYVRVAYNNEGYAILGYRLAQQSAGTEWMMLDTGVTVMKRVADLKMGRDAFSVKTPDGKTIPLATQKEYAEAGYLRSLNERAKAIRDSINYFPIEADRVCRFSFFGDLGSGANNLSFDVVDVTYDRACVGRLFFKIPGGIQYGQYWLVVKFANSQVEVPFRIFTKDEEKIAKKKWDDFKKALDESMNQ